NEHQFIHADLSQQLAGFGYDETSGRGYQLFRVAGWDYAALIEAYRQAADLAREKHIPAIVHVVEMTQPQGHSTSGSHERYKSAERMQFEKDFDPVARMRAWMIKEGIATAAQLDKVEAEASATVEQERLQAWQAFEAMHNAESADLIAILEAFPPSAEISELLHKLYQSKHIRRRQRVEFAQQALLLTRKQPSPAHEQLRNWLRAYNEQHLHTYGSHLYSQSAASPLHVAAVAPQFSQHSKKARGFEILRANFDALLEKDPRICIFGEDVGFLGDVNQGLAGLQKKYGKLRVSDTGIRETTIIGQAIGMAMRGLRPIAEIQYLDYIFYATTALTDDLSTLRWRTAGGQAAPVIVRTRGHRLEGVWHAGSHLGALTHLLRGMHICVPRNMTQAAGFYNTLMQGDDPALVIESLNGYRLHEIMPDNIGKFSVPLGVPEILRSGDDVTLVTYGSMCRIVLVAAERLARVGISAEVIDVQTLLPFDINHTIAQSVAKTNRLIVLDEDVPGGASAYILQQILEEQGAYWSLDSEPRTITSQPHRPAYSTDGDYFSKPNAESITVAVYDLMQESDPTRFP
ncbi:MAG TPA: transketolase, partial [Anaerolineae bacterium]|nr:transketolase [Anaerolineae bacterium]